MSRGYHVLLEEHYNKINHGDYGDGASAILTPFAFVPVKHEGDTEEDREDRIIEWLLAQLGVLAEEAEPRVIRMMDNCNFFNNIQRMGGANVRAVDHDGVSLSKMAMFSINHQRDMLNQRVSRLMRYTPTLQVFPVNNEYGDRLGARLSKRVIDNIFYVNDMRDLCEGTLVDAMLCGEQYAYVEYDQYAGDLDKEVRDVMAQAEAEGKKFKSHSANGRDYFVSADGTEIDVEAIKRTGEVKVSKSPAWFTLCQPAFRWKDVSYCFRGTIKHVDTIRAENPDFDFEETMPLEVSRAKSSRYGPGFTFGEWQIEWEFFHRGERFIDAGYYAKFVDNQLLSHGPLPYSHRRLPCARYSDIDNPWDAHGISFFEDIRPPIVLNNRLQNFMYRNIATAAMPKIAVPEGSSNPYLMAGGPFIIPYEPPYKPEAIVFRTIGGEVFQFSDKLMQQAQQVGGVFGISRGEVPNNARAASILNFYEEQETEKEQSNIRKYNAFVERVGELALATAGDFYQPEDERTLRVVGKHNRYKVKKMSDVSKLSGPYDVRVERTTALAETKQGRIDQIVALSTMPMTQGDTEQRKAGLFTREQILNMIEVSDTPQFFEMVTAAVDKAASENEDMFEGLPVAPAARFEAHVVHWHEHFHFMQSREFTDPAGLPPEVTQAFLDHLLVHEAEMYQAATRSMTFANAMMDILYFPAVMEIGDKPTIAQLIMMHQTPPMAPPQQAGRAGEGGAPPPEGEQAPAASENMQEEPPVQEEPLPDEQPVGV